MDLPLVADRQAAEASIWRPFVFQQAREGRCLLTRLFLSQPRIEIQLSTLHTSQSHHQPITLRRME